MPTGLELLAQSYANKPVKPRRTVDMFPEDGAQPEPPPVVPEAPDLNNPSAFESTLRTVGLGGYAVRNALMGNVEGIGRNAVDALTAIPRAILPGDQSNWELSRAQDRPEFSDVVGGMEPGWAKLGVDIAGGIATDPLSFLGVGEFSAAAKAAKAASAGVKAARASGVGLLEATNAAKAADATLAASRAAGTSRKALGVGLPFMSPVAELPGTADALASLGRGVGAGTNLAAKGIAKIPGGEDMLSGVGKLASSVRGVFGAQKATPEIEQALADAAGKGGATSLAARNAFIEANKGFAPDIQRKAHLLIQDIIEGDGPLRQDFPHVANEGFAPGTEALSPVMGPAIAPKRFNTFDVQPGLSNFGTEADQVALIDRRLAMAPWDDATKASVREAALANSPVYRKLYSQSTADQVLERPEAIWTKGDRRFPNDHVTGLYNEDMKAIDANIRQTESGIGKASKQAARQEAKIQELKPLHESAANDAYSAGTTADELFNKLPDLASRKRAVDALELKLSRMQGMADTLGRLVQGNGNRNQKLFQGILDNKYDIKQAKDALAALRKAQEGGADETVLQGLRDTARAAFQAKMQQLDALTNAAKSGDVGEVSAHHQWWNLAKEEANAAARAVKAARAEGADKELIANLSADYATKKAAAEGALGRLRNLRPKLSESNRTDNILTGGLANKQGRVREIRQLLSQLNDADLSRVGSMTKTAYRAKGSELAYTKSAERAYGRLQRAEGKLSDANEIKKTWGATLEDLKNKPDLGAWAQSQGYKSGALANDLAPLDYVPRQFDMKALDEAATHEQRGAALASMLKSRTITDSKALADKLNTPGVSIESNLGQIGADYGSQLGRATEQAAIAKNLGIKGFKNLVDPESKAAVNGYINDLRKAGDHDSANMLNTAFNGLTPPTGFWKFLANVNKPFKAAATAGIVVPRLNFTIGNVVSNVVQMLQNPEARKVALSQLKTLPRVIAGSIGDGLKTLGVRIPESDYDQLLKAAAGSDGTREGMMRLITDPQMKLAVQHGVLDGGFVSSEQLAANALTKGDPKKLQNWLYWTQDVARASEQRMRYGMFKDLLKHGETAEDAARIVNDTLFDYKFSSVGNRNARQLFPFGQYTFKAIPQAAKFLGERPAALAGLNAAYSQNDANKDPLPPWAQGNINIPLGTGESGNPQYLTSLRLPFEQLAKIPNPSGDLGDILSQVRSDVVGMASPLIKTGIAGLGGTDPRTGNPFMADDRTPNALQALGAPERGNLSRYYNALASTGVIQPLVTPVATVSSILDDRKSGGIRALSALTGLNVLDVDEQQAMKQVLMDAIRRDPSIRSTPNFYQLQKTPQGQALLQQLRTVQKAVRDKKKKAKIVGPHKAKKPKQEKPHVIKTKNSQP